MLLILNIWNKAVAYGPQFSGKKGAPKYKIITNIIYVKCLMMFDECAS